MGKAHNFPDGFKGFSGFAHPTVEGFSIFVLTKLTCSQSSLIQAGVIPQLIDNFGSNTLINLTFVPDVNPFKKFSRCLDGFYDDLSKIEQAEIEAEDTLIKVVNDLKEDDKIWLIFIDQFEELFTRTPKQTRDIFIKALDKLIQTKNEKVKLILTMRADFLDKFSPYGILGKLHDNYSLMLTEIEESGVRLAIAEPAARNGVIFEKGLIEQIISDFQFKDEDKTGNLPLLQYTLDLLWKNDDLADRMLNLETYNKLGGVRGALQLQANKIYDQFTEDEQKIVQQILLELIALEGNEAVSRRVRKENLEGDDKQAEALTKLIDNRLLVSQGKGKDATVEVAHEELLRVWDVIINLIADKRELINLRNRLVGDAEQWHNIKQQSAQTAKSELWGGTKLSRILEFKKQGLLPNLDTVTRDFIEASLQEEKLRQNAKIRTARTITGISLAGLIISGVLGWTALQKTNEADLNLADSLGRNALSLWKDNDKDLDTLLMSIKAGRLEQKHKANDLEVNEALSSTVAETWEINRLEGHNSSVSSVSFNPEGTILASGSGDKTIKLWDLKTGKEIRTLEGHNNSVSSVSFNPEGTILASGSDDNTIKLWDVKTGKEIRTLEGHNNFVRSVSFNREGTILASGSDDNTIKLWDVKTGKEIRTLEGHNNFVRSVSFNREGTILASGSWDNTIKLWDVKTGEEIRTLEGHNNSVSSVSFNPEGTILASGSDDKTIKLWDLKTGKVIRTLEGHNDNVWSVSFNPEGTILASGSEDNTIKLWDVKTGKEIRTLAGHNNSVLSVSFNPEGTILASGSGDKTIKLWNVKTGKEIRTLEGHNSFVWSVSFNQEGTILASGSGDKTIKLWDVKTGEEIRTLEGHNSDVWSVSFNQEGTILASGSGDKTIKLWYRDEGWDLDGMIEEGCEKVRNYLMYNPNVSKEDKKLCQ